MKTTLSGSGIHDAFGNEDEMDYFAFAAIIAFLALFFGAWIVLNI